MYLPGELTPKTGLHLDSCTFCAKCRDSLDEMILKCHVFTLSQVRERQLQLLKYTNSGRFR